MRLVPLALLLVACRREEPADSVFLNGEVYSMDATNTEYTAFAVSDGRLVFVGSDKGAKAFVDSETFVMDLRGRAVLPGFHDNHTHLLWSACDEQGIDLSNAATIQDIQDLTLAWANENTTAAWVQGSLWDVSVFNSILDKSQLDAVVPDRPVFLWSADGHSAFVNSKALEIAGIDRDTPDPEDGIIDHDENGEPNGVLREGAADLVFDFVPVYSDAEVDKGLAKGLEYAAEAGITTLVDANTDEWILAGYYRADQAGTLTVRVHGAMEVHPGDAEGDVAWMEDLRSRYSSNRVFPDQAKFYVDGIIESQTAVMIEPYTDGTNGIPVFTEDELIESAVALDAAGFQLHAHAIGDGGVRQFFDALDVVIATNGARDRRPLMAHIEVIDPADMGRFAETGALADFQAVWAYPDSYIQDLTWPAIGEERSEWLYPIGAVEEAGGTYIGGSDWSVTTMKPFFAIETAVTRQDPYYDSGPVLTEQHKIPLLNAIRAYTSNGALGSLSEDETGTIEVGKLADFVILDRDPFEVDVYALSDIRVDETWLEGERIH